MNVVQVRSMRQPSTSPEAPRVCVIDDDASVRAELELLIRSAGWQPRAATSAEEFLAWPPNAAPGCVLVERHLPGLSGPDFQKQLLHRTEMPVIFMSRHTDVQATVQAMKAGAFEYLTKPLAPDVVMSAISSAIEQSHVALRERARLRVLEDRYESLSARERQVMHLVIRGRLNKQIGSDLGISEITVKAHRGRMMRKMYADSLAELVTMTVRLQKPMRTVTE